MITVEIHCDKCGASRRLMSKSVDGLKKRIAGLGWYLAAQQTRWGKDMCPDCRNADRPGQE